MWYPPERGKILSGQRVDRALGHFVDLADAGDFPVLHPGELPVVVDERAGLLAIDLEALPHWWWRGVAARFRSDGGVELYDDVPQGQDFAALVSDV